MARLTLNEILSALREDYRQQLTNAERDGAELGNRYPWQTRLAVEALLRKAEKDRSPVRMLSGGIPDELYAPELTSMLRNCAMVGCDVRIAVWHSNPSTIGEGIRGLAKENPEKVQVRWSKVRGPLADRLPHFLVVGDRSYRQEAVHGDFAEKRFSDWEPSVPARINFNDPEGAEAQLLLFDLVWKACVPVEETSAPAIG